MVARRLILAFSLGLRLDESDLLDASSDRVKLILGVANRPRMRGTKDGSLSFPLVDARLGPFPQILYVN